MRWSWKSCRRESTAANRYTSISIQQCKAIWLRLVFALDTPFHPITAAGWNHLHAIDAAETVLLGLGRGRKTRLWSGWNGSILGGMQTRATSIACRTCRIHISSYFHGNSGTICQSWLQWRPFTPVPGPRWGAGRCVILRGRPCSKRWSCFTYPITPWLLHGYPRYNLLIEQCSMMFHGTSPFMTLW